MNRRASNKTAAELLGVQRTGTRGRDRLLDVAIDLFYTHGFNAVGLDQVLEAAGVTKTTFYKHFDSKEDLMEQAVRTRDQWEAQAWGRAIRERGGDNPRSQLLALFDVLDQWFNAPDFRGCIFLNTAAEFPNPNDPIHKAAASYKQQTRQGFAQLAQAAGASDVETFADHFTLLVEGTLIMRQVHGRNDAARVAKKMAAQLVEQFIPQPKKATK
jgi:AcrR family transcriptional regulator